MADAPVLVLFAHPAVERARLGPMMARAADALPHVVVRDLYELYPDFTIDVSAEQKALKRAAAVVLQFPFYWYSTPAILKEWMDLVLTHGFAYGREGRALEGKHLACALTTGGGPFAYGARGVNRYGIADFLRPLEQTAHLCRMRWRKPFVVHGTAILDDGERDRSVERYVAWLEGLKAEVA
jgi:glutathione-regulated potassium-efflux system ancillary protein KefG